MHAKADYRAPRAIRAAQRGVHPLCGKYGRPIVRTSEDCVRSCGYSTCSLSEWQPVSYHPPNLLFFSRPPRRFATRARANTRAAQRKKPVLGLREALAFVTSAMTDPAKETRASFQPNSKSGAHLPAVAPLRTMGPVPRASVNPEKER